VWNKTQFALVSNKTMDCTTQHNPSVTFACPLHENKNAVTQALNVVEISIHYTICPPSYQPSPAQPSISTRPISEIYAPHHALTNHKTPRFTPPVHALPDKTRETSRNAHQTHSHIEANPHLPHPCNPPDPVHQTLCKCESNTPGK
jgi:hypothetical protein